MRSNGKGESKSRSSFCECQCQSASFSPSSLAWSKCHFAIFPFRRHVRPLSPGRVNFSPLSLLLPSSSLFPPLGTLQTPLFAGCIIPPTDRAAASIWNFKWRERGGDTEDRSPHHLPGLSQNVTNWIRQSLSHKTVFCIRTLALRGEREGAFLSWQPQGGRRKGKKGTRRMFRDLCLMGRTQKEKGKLVRHSTAFCAESHILIAKESR